MILTIVFFLLAREVPNYNNSVTNYLIFKVLLLPEVLKHVFLLWSVIVNTGLLFSLFGNVTLYLHALENTGILHVFFYDMSTYFSLVHDFL
jgi:hypothetical protein